MKKRYIICWVLVILVCFIGLSFTYESIAKYTMLNHNGYTIVIDAGHGGRDGGSIGVNGTIEKEINLEYAILLKNEFVKMGFKVVLTRKNDDGLYKELATNKKMSDMQERMKIIKNANPNLMISIHMNSFNQPSAKGAITYYRINDEASKTVADLVQKNLKNNCDARWENGKTGDYYILNSSYYTSILIECGFISNAEEEKMLNSNEYKTKFVKTVSAAVGLYFGIVNK
jgi:N-acetylmuramoyl-L-alanine amidase